MLGLPKKSKPNEISKIIGRKPPKQKTGDQNSYKNSPINPNKSSQKSSPENPTAKNSPKITPLTQYPSFTDKAIGFVENVQRKIFNKSDSGSQLKIEGNYHLSSGMENLAKENNLNDQNMTSDRERSITNDFLRRSVNTEDNDNTDRPLMTLDTNREENDVAERTQEIEILVTKLKSIGGASRDPPANTLVQPEPKTR